MSPLLKRIKIISFNLKCIKFHSDFRYRQFAKLLSRLVRHSVQYVSDMHALFRSSDLRKDDQLCARIQVEFDIFVLRSSNYIYLSRFLGAWQYLATLPFSELHIKTLWKLYYMLTSGFSKESIENVTDGTKLVKILHLCALNFIFSFLFRMLCRFSKESVTSCLFRTLQ